MKAVVFGGSGFLGSHVADALSQAGHDVVIFDRKESPYLRSTQEMVVGDILDERAVSRTVGSSSVVYNFAGISDIDEAAQNPFETVRVNVLGNSTILEACRKAKIKRYVFASSLYVYSKAGSFYRSTKQACELVVENYQEVFGLPYTILRYGSLYGPRADDRNAIYRFLRQAIEERKITRHGDGEELREYIHVRDAAEGSVDILNDKYANQYVILTGQQQTRIKDLLLMVKEMLGNKIQLEYLPSTESYHYEITPYSFAPRVGKRLVRDSYLDMGQGILEYLHELHDQLGDHPVPSSRGGQKGMRT